MKIYLSDIYDNDINCSGSINGGACSLPSSCSAYTQFTSYNFVFNFTGSQNDNFMRVPLAAFATEKEGSGCDLFVSSIEGDSILLGTMFF